MDVLSEPRRQGRQSPRSLKTGTHEISAPEASSLCGRNQEGNQYFLVKLDFSPSPDYAGAVLSVSLVTWPDELL